jgi:hypothetical protein
MADETPSEADQQTGQAAPQLPSQDHQRTNQMAAAEAGSPPYGMYVALAALVLMSLVAFSAMLMFKDLFENATEASTMLGSLFAVVGTVVGAYFGIKTSGDTRDKMQGTIDRAHEITHQVLAEPDRGRSRNDANDTLRRRTGRQLPGQVFTELSAYFTIGEAVKRQKT